jgi:NTE family protein
MSPPSLYAQLTGKRFGLVLSAGYFGFYGHAGFLQGLGEAGLHPAAYAGTSAGGLVAAYAAAGMEVEAFRRLVLEQTRAAFWDPDPVGVLRAALPGGAGATGLLKGQRFRQLLERTLPVSRFEQLAHPLVLVGANLTRGTPEVFSRGELAPRVHATCAYPGLFRAVHLGEDLF